MLVLLLKNWQGLCELLEDLESSTLEPAEDMVVVVMN